MDVITCISCGHINLLQARFCSECGASLTEQKESFLVHTGLAPETKLRDRYVIKKLIGQGGFGKTYLAEDTGKFQQPVAIKEFTPTIKTPDSLRKAEELFQREALMLHQLDHPQIPKFWEIFQENNHLFLVQDYIAGDNYATLLEARRKTEKYFDEGEITQLLRDILPVLSYLHKNGIIHRDISPDNIIRRASDHLPVLIDFGGVKKIAEEIEYQVYYYSANHNADYNKFDDHSPNHAGTRLGKIGYAPDEQIRLGIVAPHSDLYALAVTVIVLMTGQRPQQLLDHHTLHWTWHEVLRVSPKLEGILNRMLDAKPADRFASADQILQELNYHEKETILQLDNNLNNHYTDNNLSQKQTNNLYDQKFDYLPYMEPENLAINTSGSGFFENSYPVPAEIVGWNWGAFLLPGVWCITNQVWIGLVSWVDLGFLTLGMTWFTTGVVLGVKGNEWAWRSRRWSSVKAFKRHQRIWSIIAIVFWLIVILVLILLAKVAITVFMQFFGL
jgi:serine/threonine-protein kinase